MDGDENNTHIYKTSVLLPDRLTKGKGRENRQHQQRAKTKPAMRLVLMSTKTLKDKIASFKHP